MKILNLAAEKIRAAFSFEHAGMTISVSNIMSVHVGHFEAAVFDREGEHRGTAPTVQEAMRIAEQAEIEDLQSVVE